jgi:hypothetical protein
MGEAYLFTRSGRWTEEQRLFADDGQRSDSFGRSVALSSTGATALVGAPDVQGIVAVYVFA